MDQLLRDAIRPGDVAVSLGIVVVAAVFAWLVRRSLKSLERRAREKTASVLDDYLLGAMGTPAFAVLTLVGLYVALAYLPLSESADGVLRRGILIALAAAGVFIGLAVIDAFLRWYAHDVVAETKTSLDDKLIPVLRVSVPITGGVLGMLLILRMVGIENAAVNSWLAGHGSRILVIVVVALAFFFVLSRALPQAIKKTVRQGMSGQAEEEIQKRSETLATVLVATGQVVIVGTAIMMVLSEFVSIAPILAGVGVAGIAIGFGAQSLVRDVLNGLLVIMEGQYHVGDVVRVADISGLVEDINLRRTVLRDLDGIVHFVPNGEIRVASNFTKEYSKVNMNVSVGYGTNLDHAIAVINRVGNDLSAVPEWRQVIIKPPQVLRVDKLGDSGIDIKITGETKPIKQWDVMGEMRKRLKEAFDREGIEIPWPHMKVYFGESPLHIKPNGHKKDDGPAAG